ncbi:MAG: type IV pilus secretin PilQ [Deltaproteobacteria bacterium]|nr:type IV pilus secretin PilQ [Deltaproteobacteria bacterium]
MLFAALTVGTAAPAFADGRVDAIEVGDPSGNGGADIQIRSTSFAGKRPEFSLFRLQNPARVVVDIPGVDVSGLPTPRVGGLVQAVTTTQFRGRNGPVGRVVIVLSKDADVDANVKGDAIVISARQASGAPAATTPIVKPEKGETPVIMLEGEPDAPVVGRRLQDVVAKEQDSGAVVVLKTDGQVSRYEVDEVVDPPRLIVDLYGVSADGNSEKTFSGTALKGARIGKHADKTRIVLDARGSTLPRYDVASTGEGLAILFSGKAATSADAVDVKGVTFDKKNGFWRLRLDTAAAVTVRTVKNSPDEKVIALDGARASASLLGSRGLTGGPVTDVVLEKDPHRDNSLRVTLKLNGDVEHSAWQRDGAIFWDIRAMNAPQVVASNDRVQPTAAPFSSGPVTLMQQSATAASFKGKKVTVDIQDADIVNVIRLIGDVSGKNVVVGEEVKGKVTVKLKNVPWDQALDVVLKTKDLGQETKGGIIRVVPQAKLDAEREARLKLQDEREKKLPTTVRLIPVNYAVASELTPQVKELLSARGKVTQDARTNVIIVEDIRDNLDQAERLVRTLDTQTPQVLIEARMVEGTTTFARALGIQWGGGLFFSQRGGNPTGLVFPNNVGIVGGADDAGGIGGAAQPGVFFPPNFAVNLPAQNVNSSVGVNLGSIGNFGFVNARLSAAETSGQAKIISSPRITTLNNKRARITQGTDISVPVVTQNQLTVQTVTAALELDVTPHVTADGSILMAIKLTNNVPDFSQQVGAGVPPVSTKEAETEMLVKDGDTAVIGGIYTRNTAENFAQTPFLGSIPILGWLFKNVNESDSRTEMLVFITPRIVNRRNATPQSGGL